MAELQKFSSCRSVIGLTYFGIDRTGTRNKSCITCLEQRERDTTKTVCGNCICNVTKGS